MVRQLVDIHQRGGTQISMAILATTATRIAIMPTILATTPTILSIPPSRATGTITALAGRGEVTTWSQLVERCAIAPAAWRYWPRSATPRTWSTVWPLIAVLILLAEKYMIDDGVPSVMDADEEQQQ